MNRKIYHIAFTAVASLFMLTSCNDFLDTQPDNRPSVDSESKVAALVTSAYPSNSYAFVTEVSSDNVDDYGANNPYTDRFFDQLYAWTDLTESNNDDTERFWNQSYMAIASANEALKAIDEIEAKGESSTVLTECRAEALLARAYNHFMLVNVFSKHYNQKTSTTDPGIPYTTEPETTLQPSYTRGTVAGVYEKIAEDLEAALPFVGDSHLTKAARYHFNRQAAYAFACRFYLYYEKWDKAIEYANKCLGTAPASMLRDWSYMATMPQGDAGRQAIEEHYVSANVNCNLLLLTAYSSMGLAFNPYYLYSRYSHGRYLATLETGEAVKVLWGGGEYYERMAVYEATNMDMTIFWKLPLLFEYTDPVAGTGYRHTVITALTADECLLNRAEAYILKGEYDKALADMNLWISNIVRADENPQPLTLSGVVDMMNALPYAYSDVDGIASTPKKHLNPDFTIGAEGSEQECMLQCLLMLRRVETLQTGLRWFDIKRYGIEYPRRTMNASGLPFKKTDFLSKDDPRRAIQIPLKVRQAGLEANPRN